MSARTSPVFILAALLATPGCEIRCTTGSAGPSTGATPAAPSGLSLPSSLPMPPAPPAPPTPAEPTQGAPPAPAASGRLLGPFTADPGGGAVPAAPDAVRPDTAQFYVGWEHSNLNSGDAVAVQLTTVDVGNAAPPGTVVTTSTMNAAGAGPNHGVVTFSAPSRGWPPGRYRLSAASNGAQFAATEFVIQ